ncbi:hypothetical protein Ancab_026645 [Ancistrocladus abbreviatus]
MAATANSSNPHSTTLSPRSSSLSSAAAGDAVHGNSSHTRWAPAAGGGPRMTTASPWTQIVKSGGGGESEVSVTGMTPASPSAPAAVVAAAAVVVQQQTSPSKKGPVVTSQEKEKENSMVEVQAQQTESSSGNGNGSGNGIKKPVWNRQPPPIVNSLESGPVMGAASWPALSESTKASPKLSPSDSSKFPADGSISLSQAIGAASPSSPSSPSLPSSVQKQVSGNVNPTPTPNHGRPTRQKSMKRDGGGSGLVNGGFSHQLSPHGSVGEASHNSSMKPGSGALDSSARDHGHNNVNRETGQRTGGDHQHQRNSYRRGNSGPHSRGDGSHQNHGSRHDKDSGNHEWNYRRNFNGRDAAMPSPRTFGRGFVRQPPPSPAQFIPPPIMRPFVGPMGMGMPELPPIYFVGHPPSMPFVASMPPMYVPPPDPQLHAKLVNQIDYYFSEENLIRDTYLRQNMDEQGWVPIALIAGFKKVLQLTDDVQFISDVLQASNVVEVQGEKIRKRDNWKKWIMPPSVQFPTASGSLSPRLPSHDLLATRVQSVVLDTHSNSRGQVDATAETLLRSSSGDLNCQPQISNERTSSSGF